MESIRHCLRYLFTVIDYRISYANENTKSTFQVENNLLLEFHLYLYNIFAIPDLDSNDTSLGQKNC